MKRIGMGRTGAALGACAMLLCGGPAAAAEEGWRFSLSPYAWLAGIGGDVTLRGRDLGQSGSTKADFGDILADLKFAFMGMVELRHGRLGLIADFLYLDIEADISTRHDVLFDGGRGNVSTTGLGLAALYRVVEDPRGSLDLGAGLRPWWVDTSLHLNPGQAAGRSASSSVSWTDPVLAMRGHLRLSERVGLTAYFDIGGFGVGSELTWQALGTLDWQANDRLALRAGWRHLSFDFENAATTLKLSISGPIIGATYRF